MGNTITLPACLHTCFNYLFTDIRIQLSAINVQLNQDQDRRQRQSVTCVVPGLGGLAAVSQNMRLLVILILSQNWELKVAEMSNCQEVGNVFP